MSHKDRVVHFWLNGVDRMFEMRNLIYAAVCDEIVMYVTDNKRSIKRGIRLQRKSEPKAIV